MNTPGRLILTTCIAFLVAMVVAGIDWGLPSRESDAFLFASHRVWTGAELSSWDQDRRDRLLGADVDRNPLDRSTWPMVLNDSDQKRQEILRRYRLYSSQPDEMITFMALQQMNPSGWDFDPKLYQYGGLWVYPVGALLKVCSLAGLIELRQDLAYYYDHPESFGRFYVVARLYTVMWYAVLLAGVAGVVKRLTGDNFLSIATASLVGICPVVFALAHEAKPHLAGCALMVLSVWSGMIYRDQGGWKRASWTGILCGFAAGMVISAAVVGVILPVMVLLRSDPWRRRIGVLGLSVLACIFAYALTNPYVVWNLVQDASVLRSNASNTASMYGLGGIESMVHDGTARLIEAASLPVLVLAGLAGVIVLIKRQAISRDVILLSIPTVMVLIPFFAYASGKPSEYARFSLFAVTCLCMTGMWTVGSVRPVGVQRCMLVVVPVLVWVVATQPYFTAFDLDCRRTGTRELAARMVQNLSDRYHTLRTPSEPAPYVFPPVDLWNWRIVLTNDLIPQKGEITLHTIDSIAHATKVPLNRRQTLIDAGQRPAPITWANKPFELIEGLTEP
jgi:hypothetical protein